MSRFQQGMRLPFITRARLLRNSGPSLGRITRTRNCKHATTTTIGLLTIGDPSHMIHNSSTPQYKVLTIILTQYRRLMMGALQRQRRSLFLYLFNRPILINLRMFFLSRCR